MLVKGYIRVGSNLKDITDRIDNFFEFHQLKGVIEQINIEHMFNDNSYYLERLKSDKYGLYRIIYDDSKDEYSLMISGFFPPVEMNDIREKLIKGFYEYILEQISLMIKYRKSSIELFQGSEYFLLIEGIKISDNDEFTIEYDIEES